MGREHAQARNRVACQLNGNEHGGNRVSDNQYTVLGYLSVGNAFHATEYRIDEYNNRCDDQTGGGIHFQEAGEGHTSASHLADNVGYRGNDQTDNGYQSRVCAVVSIPDELRNRKLTELPQVRSQQHGQQDVATGPAHKERGVGIATGRDQTSHGDKRSGRHPVSTDCGAVGDRMHTTARNVEIAGTAGLGPDSDGDVEEERAPYEHNVDCKLAHLSLLLMHAEFFVDLVHAPCIVKDQNNEGKDGALLGKPEAQIGAAYGDSRQH